MPRQSPRVMQGRFGPRSDAVGGASDVPMFDDENPDHVMSLRENFSNYATPSAIGTHARADGGQAWATGASSFWTFRTSGVHLHPFPTPAGSGKTLEIDMQDEPSPGNAHNRGLGIQGSNYPWLNAPTLNNKDCLVQYLCFRSLGTNCYIGKWVDWNVFVGNQTWRYDMDGPCTCGFPMGEQGVGCQSTPLCTTYWSGACSGPRFSGVPPSCDPNSPSLNLSTTVNAPELTHFYRDMMNYVADDAAHDWGFLGEQTVADGAWRMVVQRFTRGAARGKGRLEQWVWPAGGDAVKTLDLNGADGAVGPYDETGMRGHVHVQMANLDWISDINGTNGNLTSFNLCNLSAVEGIFPGGVTLQIGEFGMWGHSPS
jgi:hypothetical protein